MKAVIIDDDQALCRSLQIHLDREGHEARVAHTAADGLALLDAERPDVAFIDLKLPDQTGLEILRALQERQPTCLGVMITGTQDTKATIEAVRLGAFDYIRKPLDLDAVMVTLEKALRKRPAKAAQGAEDFGEANPHEIVGADPAIVEVIKQVGRLSQNQVPVLIQGESGTGKELVARALHEAAAPDQPFVAINCSAIVPALMESELFGHVRGAFTGADRDKRGRLEEAGEGVMFFDEIGDMSLALQAKLLRALQERSFERVGSAAPVPLRARVVAATHRDLSALVAEGAFREDLYYRLAVSHIRVPPLRERRGDFPILARHLLAQISRDLNVAITGLEEAAIAQLQTHSWPGNVREMENALTRAALMSRESVLTQGVIAAAMAEPASRGAAAPTDIKPLSEAERDHIEQALHATNWNITRTAKLLEVSPTTLRKKIGDFGLAHPGA